MKLLTNFENPFSDPRDPEGGEFDPENVSSKPPLILQNHT
jgi:hypothetical protein